ncbi:hypothetical protein [Pedobacter hiemivivus]|uniref:Uncharacterized protein n=1 Tax=Pedobacter hiemivivus TaxID=2530454 RepID=A0A4R0N5V3_9SPHI|nr:hypothetical protein [Pedobacter hiemivivus]TCC94723.1 hypothetical protein EZ444_17155 [Pedobacter hiemivivus]
MKKLRSKVVKALKKEFTFECTISSRMNQVILNVKNIDFEQHLGQLIQQTQLIIDKYFPQREDHLCLVIREIGGTNENKFKIWKPTY